MVSLVYSGSVYFQSFEVGILAIRPPATPRLGLDVHMKEHVNYIRSEHRQKEGRWSKIVAPLHQRS